MVVYAMVTLIVWLGGLLACWMVYRAAVGTIDHRQS